MNLKYFTFSPQIVWKTYVVLELSLQLPHRSSELNSVVVLISCGISYELKQVSVFSFDISIFMYMFLAGLGLLVVVGLHQLLESRKVSTLELSSSCWGLPKLVQCQVQSPYLCLLALTVGL